MGVVARKYLNVAGLYGIWIPMNKILPAFLWLKEAFCNCSVIFSNKQVTVRGMIAQSSLFWRSSGNTLERCSLSAIYFGE